MSEITFELVDSVYDALVTFNGGQRAALDSGLLIVADFKASQVKATDNVGVTAREYLKAFKAAVEAEAKSRGVDVKSVRIDSLEAVFSKLRTIHDKWGVKVPAKYGSIGGAYTAAKSGESKPPKPFNPEKVAKRFADLSVAERAALAAAILAL